MLARSLSKEVTVRQLTHKIAVECRHLDEVVTKADI